jgi:hypothetical protein
VKRKPYVPPSPPEPIGPRPLPPFRYRAPVTACRPSDDLGWLRTTLQEFDVKEERDRERDIGELELRVIDRTSEVGEKWQAEIKLLEDIGYNGRELDLEDGGDYDILKRRVDLLRMALDE